MSKILCQEMCKLPKCVKPCSNFTTYAQIQSMTFGGPKLYVITAFVFQDLGIFIMGLSEILSWEQQKNVWGEPLASWSLRMNWVIHGKRSQHCRSSMLED